MVNPVFLFVLGLLTGAASMVLLEQSLKDVFGGGTK